MMQELILMAENCTACELSKSRTNVVFADGNPETARAILIGEAPGANEDATGVPFVGRAGKLLNEFLAQAGISREKDLYIINTIKCRPPENRVPKPSEKKACEHFLFAQIEAVQPKVLIFCGATAFSTITRASIAPCQSDALEGSASQSCAPPSHNSFSTITRGNTKPEGVLKAPISKIRGQWLEVEVNGKKYKAMAIFHPSYLLRNHRMEEGSPRMLMNEDLKLIAAEIIGD